ncbi:MAG: hypothetical protein AAF563_02250 [Pseudomonadota bacterium]
MAIHGHGVLPFLLDIARLHTAPRHDGSPRVARGGKRDADPKHVVIETPRQRGGT